METVAMNRDFWKGRRVFVTGHTGFKGSWLCLSLQEAGAVVTGYALPPPTTPSLFDVAHVANGMHSITGDLRDYDAVRTSMLGAKPEVVIHMAAQALVRYSYAHPLETYAVNVLGTAHVLEAARAVSGLRAIVNVTSDKCYENREWDWGYRENEPLGGYDPYSSSKGCAELVTGAYRQSYFNPAQYRHHGVALASVRAGNVIGGGDWAADRLIPDIIRAIAKSEEVVIRSPNAIRPWQHVLEPISGYMLIAERLATNGGEYAEAWNFGPSEEDVRPVEWIARALTQRWGGNARFRIDTAAAMLHEAHYLKLDCSKARNRLGWHPRWRLSEALDRIVEWHRALILGQNMREVTLGQIRAFAQA